MGIGSHGNGADRHGQVGIGERLPHAIASIGFLEATSSRTYLQSTYDPPLIQNNKITMSVDAHEALGIRTLYSHRGTRRKRANEISATLAHGPVTLRIWGSHTRTADSPRTTPPYARTCHWPDRHLVQRGLTGGTARVGEPGTSWL
jgi:hypothetical protein